MYRLKTINFSCEIDLKFVNIFFGRDGFFENAVEREERCAMILKMKKKEK